MKKRFTQLIAAGALALVPGIAVAAGARITWSQPAESLRYKLFVAQPAVKTTKLKQFRINTPRRTEDGYYYYDVHGIDPLEPAYFLMVSIDGRGVASGESNTMELGSESFCEIFDVDADGSVDSSDALAVARKALGLGKTKEVKVKGSIILAFEILKMVSTSQCT